MTGGIANALVNASPSIHDLRAPSRFRPALSHLRFAHVAESLGKAGGENVLAAIDPDGWVLV